MGWDGMGWRGGEGRDGTPRALLSTAKAYPRVFLSTVTPPCLHPHLHYTHAHVLATDRPACM